MPSDTSYRHDRTIHKVYWALWRAGLTYDQAVNAVNELFNDGIQFRETA